MQVIRYGNIDRTSLWTSISLFALSAALFVVAVFKVFGSSVVCPKIKEGAVYKIVSDEIQALRMKESSFCRSADGVVSANSFVFSRHAGFIVSESTKKAEFPIMGPIGLGAFPSFAEAYGDIQGDPEESTSRPSQRAAQTSPNTIIRAEEDALPEEPEAEANADLVPEQQDLSPNSPRIPEKVAFVFSRPLEIEFNQLGYCTSNCNVIMTCGQKKEKVFESSFSDRQQIVVRYTPKSLKTLRCTILVEESSKTFRQQVLMGSLEKELGDLINQLWDVQILN